MCRINLKPHRASTISAGHETHAPTPLVLKVAMHLQGSVVLYPGHLHRRPEQHVTRTCATVKSATRESTTSPSDFGLQVMDEVCWDVRRI